MNILGNLKRGVSPLHGISVALSMARSALKEENREQRRLPAVSPDCKQAPIPDQGQSTAPPGENTIELRHRDKCATSFRVPEWTNPPEIIEWNGKRFVKEANRQYREAVTFSLYAGYNAELVQTTSPG